MSGLPEQLTDDVDNARGLRAFIADFIGFAGGVFPRNRKVFWRRFLCEGVGVPIAAADPACGPAAASAAAVPLEDGFPAPASGAGMKTVGQPS